MSAVRTSNVTLDALPVLFLDLDDVLCINSPCGGFDAIAAVNGRHVNPAWVYQRLFEPDAVSAMKQVHDKMNAAVRYVISSTWRESFSRAQLEVVFRRTGLGFVANRLLEGEKWRTPPKFGRSRRIDEIAQWLDRHHQGESFVILDDTHSGASLIPTMHPSPMRSSNVPAPRHSGESALHPFAGRVVLCDENVGLTSDHVPFILAALRRPVPVARIAA